MQHIKKMKVRGFTIVELIVVMTILVILGAMGIMSFMGYNSSSRDAVRGMDIVQMGKALQQFSTASGEYPMPENKTGTGIVNGKELVHVGNIAEGISRILKVNKVPLDPLSKTNYAYGISADKKFYQIATVLENKQTSNLIIDEAYANAEYQAKIIGNYNKVLKFSTGSESWIVNIPSLIFNVTGGNTVNLLSTGTFYVVDKLSNLPYKINANTNINNKNGDQIIQEINKFSTATLTGVNITEIVNKTKTVEQVFGTGYSMESQALLASFGMNERKADSTINTQLITAVIFPTTPEPVTVSWANCTATSFSGYTISILSHAQTQSFQKAISNGTGTISATCTNGALSYGNETRLCNSGFVQQNGVCVSESCSGTTPSNGAVSNATSIIGGTWNYNTTPGLCTYACDTNYTTISNLCYEKCGVDQYRTSPTSTTCTSVGVGYFSPVNNDSRSNCTNLPANSVYSSAGGGSNNCDFVCNTGFAKSGNTCVAVCGAVDGNIVGICNIGTNTWDNGALGSCGETKYWTCTGPGFSQSCSYLDGGSCST